MEWQPIETAPRDGTPILAWNGGVFVVYWESDPGSWWVYDPPCDERAVWNVKQPTHWMPLPPPPLGAEQ